MKKVSIAFQTDKTSEEYIRLAKLVDKYNFDVVSVYCDAPFHPSYGPLYLMSPHIKQARMGPAAVSPFRIHPIDIAANTALLSQMTSGRVYIGIARGAWLEDHGIPEPDRPITAIREAIEIIKTLLSGELDGFEGKVYKIARHVRAPYSLPNMKIPVVVGTWGPKLAAVAGEIADEVKVGGSANPYFAPVIQRYIRKGELAAGREEGSVGIVMGAVTVVDENRQLARKIAREKTALYLPVVAKLDPTLSLDPQMIKQIKSLTEEGEWESAGRLISDEVLDCFAFAGSADDVINQAGLLFEAGVDRIEFGTPHGVTHVEGINLIGKVVLPVLKASFNY